MAKKLYDWRITRIRGNASHVIGQVKASSAEATIEQVAEKYDIRKGSKRKRLAARRCS